VAMRAVKKYWQRPD